MFRIIKKGFTRSGDEYIGDHSISRAFKPGRWTVIKDGDDGSDINGFITLLFRRKEGCKKMKHTRKALKKVSLKYAYGIVWAFLQGDNIFDIAWVLGRDKKFVEAIIREYMIEGKI